jgi:siroheme decarboxylase
MDDIDKRLLNDYQRDFPLCAKPYEMLANKLSITENEVLARLNRLKADGHISRIGGIVKPGSVGASTLAALKVPKHRIDEVADYINGRVEVNHNYLREHKFNMWFVLNCSDGPVLQETVTEIENDTGLKVLVLPMLQDFHLDLGFGIKWHS